MEDHRKSLAKSKDQPIKAEWSSRCVVFTYFQGDINTVVDEHFSRALQNVKNPQDLSIKTKNESIILKTDNHMPHGHINFSPQWTKHEETEPTFNLSTSGLDPSVDHYAASILQSHHSQPTDMWQYPPMGTISPSVQGYQHHSIPAELQMGPTHGSLLSLLQQERCTPSMQLPIIKHEQSSPCALGPAGSHMMQSISPQGDIHSHDRRKDVFHSQERRPDVYFY